MICRLLYSDYAVRFDLKLTILINFWPRMTFFDLVDRFSTKFEINWYAYYMHYLSKTFIFQYTKLMIFNDVITGQDDVIKLWNSTDLKILDWSIRWKKNYFDWTNQLLATFTKRHPTFQLQTQKKAISRDWNWPKIVLSH